MKIVTVIRLDTGQPFIPVANMITNTDGSVSFQLPTGLFAGQAPWVTGEPSTYGVRHPDSDLCGSYQRATLSGNLVTFLTRDQDIPVAYLVGVGQAY